MTGPTTRPPERLGGQAEQDAPGGPDERDERRGQHARDGQGAPFQRSAHQGSS